MPVHFKQLNLQSMKNPKIKVCNPAGNSQHAHHVHVHVGMSTTQISDKWHVKTKLPTQLV